jgi:hypothetical protein
VGPKLGFLDARTNVKESRGKTMKCVRAVTVALLFFGAGVQAYARQDQQDEKQSKPEKTRQAGSKPNLYTVTPLAILMSHNFTVFAAAS